MVDTSDEWIVQRTGIRERHIAADGEFTSDLGLAAARAALAAAQVDAQSIDLIVLATSTPDNTFPATAVSIQAGLGITQGAAIIEGEQAEWRLRQAIHAAMKENINIANVVADKTSEALFYVAAIKSSLNGKLTLDYQTPDLVHTKYQYEKVKQ